MSADSVEKGVSASPNAGGLRSSRQILIASLLSFVAVLLLMLPVEWQHWAYTFSQPRPFVAWMASFNADITPYFFWMFAVLIFYRWRFHLADPDSRQAVTAEAWLQAGRYLKEGRSGEQNDPKWLMRLLSIGVFLLGISSAVWVSDRFENLPASYHDEYSYQFQVETFLQGRITNERFEEAPELFDQMHILNDAAGKFTSRYFPGTGIWMLPFAAIGSVYWGYYIAHALIALLAFWIVRDLAGNATGLLAGIFCAVSPGISLFSNLLLAHHPCLVGILFFLWMFNRWSIRKQYRHSFLAAIGLIFAMYCRPMTAFGIGLPYGIWFWVSVLKAQQFSRSQKAKQILAMGTPIAVGLLLLLPYNAKTTGEVLLTPYSQYTRLHTPRHMYGFHNRRRGEKWIAEQQKLGKNLPVIESYDRWAEELTFSKAVANEQIRLISSTQWILGTVPILAGVIFFCAIGHQDRKQWWGIFAAVCCLHLVHLPYWYAGIMHWHYVFESAPLLIMVFARSTQLIAYNARLVDRHWLSVWWIGLPLISLLITYTTFEPFWNSRMTAGIEEVKFAKQQHALFNQMIEQNIPGVAVLFIKKKPEDLHLDFVINSPRLDARVLRAHWLPEKYSVQQLQQLFPNRKLYLIDLPANRLSKLSP